MDIIIGCVVGALILILAVIGVVIWKMRSSGYKTTNSCEKSRCCEKRRTLGTDSDSSSQSSVDSLDSGAPMIKQKSP
uniref:Uncharacterized protein n=1 Tax=Anguilla anguilla TaxID=7936 RepID=A0A0E9XZ67_ANGAN